MNSEQLKETTMDKASRQLIRVSIEDAALAERRVTELMGDNSAIRKT
jgi:topoisomerase-4 subunit B